MITLSILIPTTTKRATKFFSKMIDHLNAQLTNLKRNDVEILGLLDNYKMTIGEKRNKLLHMANGRFLMFIDDDDTVTDDFLFEILSAIDKNPNSDCVVYEMLCTINGCRRIMSRFGIEYEYTKTPPWTLEYGNYKNDVPDDWFGKPSHNMVWRSELAKTCVFPSANTGEDFAWVAQAWPKIKKQTRISKLIYYYNAVLGKDY